MPCRRPLFSFPGKPGIALVCSLLFSLLSNATAAQPGITFTAEQAANGETTYKETCQICHGNRLSNGQFGTPLRGSFFRNNWKGKTLGELVLQTRDEMPPDNKQSLSLQQAAEVVAFILSRNDIAPGESPVTADLDTLNRIPLPWE